MRRATLGAMAVMALAWAAPGAAAAQARADGETWWEWAAPVVVGGERVPTRRGVVVIPDRRGEVRGGPRAQGNGPAFCRNGQGHPVHGRQWCYEKGWGLDDGRYDPRWERRRWEDIVFRAPRDRRSGVLDELTLIDVLGRVVFGRLQEHGHQLGAHGPIVGRWTGADTGGRVLQLRAGGLPLAELTDLDGDGRVDLVLVHRGR